MSTFTTTSLIPQTEEGLLSIQKKALLKRSFVATTGLSSASRTVNTSTGSIANPGYKGVMVTLTITSITAGGLKLQLLTGVTAANTVYIDISSITAALSRTVVVYPGMSGSAAQLGSPGCIGPVFLINVNHDTADPITYSVTYSFIE